MRQRLFTHDEADPSYVVDEEQFALHPRVSMVALQLRSQANQYATLFGAPIYLCGSMLYDEHPGDVDIRCIMHPKRAAEMFGEKPYLGSSNATPAWLAKSREELKQSRRMTRNYQVIGWPRVDFQFAPALLDNKNALRLDTIPDYIFHAGDRSSYE